MLKQHQLGQVFKIPENSKMSSYRLFLLELVQQGLNGQPVLKALCELEQELLLQSDDQIERFTSLLPIKVLMLVLLLQFPHQ